MSEMRMCTLTRKALGLAVAIIMLVLIGIGSSASAATITVDSLEDNTGGGHCTLREAINSAKGSPGVGTCTAGTGSDVIQFSVTGAIMLGSTLPEITTTLTIAGPNGSLGIAIEGDGTFRLLQVASGGTLNLEFLTLNKGGVVGPTGPLRPGPGQGGAILNNGTLTIAYSTFSSNHATGGSGSGLAGSGDGGAIFNNGTLTISASTFSSNGATGGDGAPLGGSANGGAIRNNGMLTVLDSTFSENQAIGGASSGGALGGSASGPAIYNMGTAIVTNSTFSANVATGGAGDPQGPGYGAIFSSYTATGTVTITNSTFSDNRAIGTLLGGGAIQGGGGRFQVIIKGVILAGSAPSNCGSSGKPRDDGYNIADDSSCNFTTGTSKVITPTSEIKLDSDLKDNGGPTKTLALMADSPAIDAIPVESCTYPSGSLNPCTIPPSITSSDQLTCDQRGYGRPAPRATACDIGAYEFGAVKPTPTPTPTYTPTATPTETATPTPTPTATATAVPARIKLRPATAFFVGSPRQPGSSTSFRVINEGPGTAAIGLAHTDNADFRITHNSCSGARLAPGMQCSITVRFDPRTAGVVTGSLIVKDNVTNRPLHSTLVGVAF